MDNVQKRAQRCRLFSKKNDEGNALIFIISIVGFLAIIGFVLTSIMKASVETTSVNRAIVQARAVSESGLEYVSAMLSELQKPDGTVAADFAEACTAWQTAGTISVGPASSPDGHFKVSFQNAADLNGNWVNGCPSVSTNRYFRIISDGTAQDKGVGTERGSKASMVSVFRLPGAGTPGGADPEDLPGLDLWTLSKGEDVYRTDVSPNRTFKSSLPYPFLSATGKQWIRLISSENSTPQGQFWQSGTMIFKEKFDAGTKPLELEFNYRMYKRSTEGILQNVVSPGGDWHNGGDLGLGDGFSFFFLDASRTTDATPPGAPGAGLGYSSASAGGTGNKFDPINQGIAGGYLGIGFDTFGNFQKSEAGGDAAINAANATWSVASVPGNRRALTNFGLGATRKAEIWNDWNPFGDGDKSSSGNPNAYNRRLPESIGIRGEGYTHASPGNSWNLKYGFREEGKIKGGYRWLKGTNAYLASATSSNNSFNSNPSLATNWLSNEYNDDTSYRRVKFVTVPHGGKVDVEVYLHPTIFKEGLNDYDEDVHSASWGTPTLKITNIAAQPGQTDMPDQMYFGMSASSGWAVSTVEIGNLTLTSDGETVIDITDEKYGALGSLISKNDVRN